MISDLFYWIQNHFSLVIELLGLATALIYLYFSIRQKIWLWPFGILTSSFYILVFSKSRLYADMGLQVYYLVISFYGWYYWLFRGNKKGKNSLQVSSASLKSAWKLALSTFIIYWMLVIALKYIPPWLNIPASTLIYWDAFTTAASIVATWMLARKILEQWLIWILVDAVSMILYIYKGLYLTAGLFLVYSLLAVLGYFEWKKAMTSDGLVENH